MGIAPPEHRQRTLKSDRTDNDPLHVPVLFHEVLDALELRPGMTVVDCTVGLGGHSAAMISRIGVAREKRVDGAMTGGRLIGIDLDPANLSIARPNLEREGRYFGVKVDLFNTNFAGVQKVLAEAGVERVDGLLADVGIASTQIDDPARGFSYRKPGPLDMRMDPTRGKPASALVNTMPEAELAAALLELGDESDAEPIARLIAERRKVAPILTTQDLMAIVCKARDFTIHRAAHAKLHPAARTFQALRILVNRELANLERLLAVIPDVLAPGGRAAIISFHSGEDRLVKNAFRDGFRAGIYAEETRDAITATDEEIKANARARSAKLRWVQRA